jgi:Domain of unknown function (DUF4189)
VATWRPHHIGDLGMRRFLFLAWSLAVLCVPHEAFSMHMILCAGSAFDFRCFAASHPFAQDEAAQKETALKVIDACVRYFGGDPDDYCGGTLFQQSFADTCAAVAEYQRNPFMQGGRTSEEARQSAMNFCRSRSNGMCNIILTVCNPTAGEQPSSVVTATQHDSTATSTVPAPSTTNNGVSAENLRSASPEDLGGSSARAASALAALDGAVIVAAILLNLILFVVLFKPIRDHQERLWILGRITVACFLVTFFLPAALVISSDPYFSLIVTFLQRATGIGFYVAGIFFLILYVRSLVHHGLPKTLPAPSEHIEVLIGRSQRRNWLNRVVFVVDARMGVSLEQLRLIKKYRLGWTLVFDSASRERQNELARAHLQMASEKWTQTICLWRAEKRGVLSRLYYLVRAFISFLLGFLFIRVTVATLLRGAHIESRSLDTILAAKNAMEKAAIDLKAYLEVAECFDGREDLFEPS